jgi:WD40 repeat protein
MMGEVGILAELLLAVALDDPTLAGHLGGGAIAFSPDGKWLATHGGEGLRVWDLSTGHERALEKAAGVPRPVPERYFGFTLDGKELVLYERGHFRTWTLETGALIREIRGPATAGAGSLLSPDGRTFVATGENTGARLHRTDREDSLALDLPEGEISSIGFSEGGDRVVVSGTRRGRGGWVTVREVATGRDLCSSTVPPPDGSRTVVIYTPPGSLLSGGKRLAVARAKGTHVPGLPLGASTVLLWDVEAQRMTGGMDGQRGPIWGMASPPAGTRLATWGSSDLVVWDPDAQKPILSRPGMIHQAVFSPDGAAVAFIASADEVTQQERMVTVVEIDTGKDRFFLPAARYQGLAFSPDGKTLAATSDRGIHLRDAVSGAEQKPPGR